MLNVNGIVTVLSVEDLGLSNNESKTSYITLFVKEFGKEDNMFRVTAFGSNAEYIARNILTETGVPYVGDGGIAKYCQLHSKDERKNNKVKIKARRVQINGTLEVSTIEREMEGITVVPTKGGGTKKVALPFRAEVQSTRVIVTNAQFIDAKIHNNANGESVSSGVNDEEIDYEALADAIVEDNLQDTTGTEETTIEVNADKNEGPNLGKDFKGR